MSEHDATSIIGQMAGMAPVAHSAATVEQLVERFCSGSDADYSGCSACVPRRDDNLAADIYDGFCGYVGGEGDELVTGFDDGYAFMGYLADRGWHPLNEVGQWPYVVYLMRFGEGDELPAVVSYTEADLRVMRFDSLDDLRRYVVGLRTSS